MRYPALFFGMFALLGLFGALFTDSRLFIPLFIVCSLFTIRKEKIFLALQITLALFLMIKSGYHFPEIGHEAVEGTLNLRITSIAKSESNFQKKMIYKGVGRVFQTAEGETYGQNFPCRIVVPLPKESAIKKEGAYLIRGRLKAEGGKNYRFFPDRECLWQPLKTRFNLTWPRYRIKEAIKGYAERAVPQIKAARFLGGMITGDFEDQMLRNAFSSLGLSHVMAISGFHFSIVAAIFSLLCRPLFRPKRAAIFLSITLSCYFLLIGPSPSILRAWVMHLSILFSLFAKNPSSGLNSLGTALLIILLFDPLQTLSIGFVFSFSITAAILIWFKPMEIALDRVMRKRPLRQVIEMGVIDKHLYLTLAAAKKAVALNLAVNLFALPLTLFYFHRFPVLGLLYNAFIPFLIAISLSLFLLACLSIPIFPPVGEALHYLNGHFTAFILSLIDNVPPSLNAFIRAENLPFSLVVSLLVMLVLLGLTLRKRINSLCRIDEKPLFG